MNCRIPVIFPGGITDMLKMSQVGTVNRRTTQIEIAAEYVSISVNVEACGG